MPAVKAEERWKEYWEERGRQAGANYEADHRSSKDAELDQIAERDLLAFVDPQKEDVVLDAGCGTGANVSMLSPRVRSIVGIDYSEQMVGRAQKRISEQNIHNATVRVSNIAGMGFESNSFDKILCISVLQYLNDDDCLAALHELVRVSKNGGLIILHVKNLASLYLGSLYIAKRLKSLISSKTKIEYYRTQRWYERQLGKLQAQPIQFDAHHIFVVDFLPGALYEWVARTERKYYRSRFLRRYGSEYFIKARVDKGPASDQ